MILSTLRRSREGFRLSNRLNIKQPFVLFHHSPIYASEKKEDDPQHGFTAWEKAQQRGNNGIPDFLEHWNKNMFLGVGFFSTFLSGVMVTFNDSLLGVSLFGLTTAYFYIGYKDMNQTKHAVRKNFPFLGNLRYLFEVLRPEIMQYFIENDRDGRPFNRLQRNVAYQRAKNMTDTLPFGTRKDVYQNDYEWIGHSMYPKEVDDRMMRTVIGEKENGCEQPYSASLLNISAMSFGSLSQNAVLALNQGAQMGNFFHNTGEGGVSPFHVQPGGDICWNIGTGYFGCRTRDGNFNPDMFVERLEKVPQIKMIEIKLSQGAKPGHGGILPASKITSVIEEIRGVKKEDGDVLSPPQHKAFDSAEGLLNFVQTLRTLSGGKPIGFKMCVGHPGEVAGLVTAMLQTGITPDFITIDGAEGGTGAAPPEFSDSIGMPMLEGLHIWHNLLVGAGLRERTKIIVAGKVITGFHIVKLLALGADTCNAARAFMFSLGCIQALKCNTNKCPTGVATTNPELYQGLDPQTKAARVLSYHHRTIHSAQEIIGAAGVSDPRNLNRNMIFHRSENGAVRDYSEIFPEVQKGCIRDTKDVKHLIDINPKDGFISLEEFQHWSKENKVN